jgi:hypothetical protein
MTVYVDIDGTICNNTNGRYETAYPIHEYIEKVNKLYDEGNTIIYWTARGGTTGIDWSELTKKQLSEWGCKFHKLEDLPKPSYDLFIDDKTKRIEEV